MAPYSPGDLLKSDSRPLQLCPVTARAGMLRAVACNLLGPRSLTREVRISFEKSQAATRSARPTFRGEAPCLNCSSSSAPRARLKRLGRSSLPS